jgi:hypothetical protein
MGNLKQDIGEAAEQIARALRSSNYRTNFSPESLWEVDLFFDDHSEHGAPKPKGLLAEKLGQRLFALGGYVGETIRRNLGGDWQADDADPQGEINISLKLADGTLIWPVQRVMKRLKNGPEEGIAVYGSALGLAVGARPAPFSPYRSQGSAVPVVPINIPSARTEYGLMEHKISGCVLLFLGSALLYALLAGLVASLWDRNIRLLPSFYLLIDAGLFWGGVRLWSAWRAVLGRIWLCFCPLAVFNSFYYRHLQNDPLMLIDKRRINYLTVMSKSALVMAALALLAGVTMLIVHRSKMKADARQE